MYTSHNNDKDNDNDKDDNNNNNVMNNVFYKVLKGKNCLYTTFTSFKETSLFLFKTELNWLLIFYFR